MLHSEYTTKGSKYPMGKSSRKKKQRNDGGEQGADAPKEKGRILSCYKCGKDVSEYDTGCPHCGAKPPRVNPAVLARVLLGVIIAIILYIYFM